jgi:hypothetical protein
VCDRTVSKALPSVHAVAPTPDRELAEARACIDRGDERSALKRLDRARRGYLKHHDTAGLEHLLVLADVLDADDEQVLIGRENLVYAIKQNLRFESRRQAQQRRDRWADPYPGLEAPTPHTRIALTRGAKLAIALGTLAGTAALVAVFALPAIFSESETHVRLRLVNDTGQPARVRGCDDADCTSSWMHADLDPGLTTERNVPARDLVDLFRVERAGVRGCLPVRVHDAYEQFGGDRSQALVVPISASTPCPGITVLPQPAPEEGL